MCDAYDCDNPAKYRWEIVELAAEAAELGITYVQPKYCVMCSALRAAQNPTFKYVGEVEEAMV